MNFETAKKRQYKNGSVRYYIIIKSHQYHHLTIIGILCRFQTIISNLFWKIWKIIKDLILWKWMFAFTTRMGVSQGCLSPLALFLVTLSGLTPFPYYQLNMLGATWEQFQTSEFHLLKLCCFLLWFSFFGRELVLVGVRNRRSMSLFHNLLQSSGISFDPIHRHLFWFDKLPRGVIPHAIFIFQPCSMSSTMPISISKWNDNVTERNCNSMVLSSPFGSLPFSAFLAGCVQCNRIAYSGLYTGKINSKLTSNPLASPFLFYWKNHCSIENNFRTNNL